MRRGVGWGRERESRDIESYKKGDKQKEEKEYSAWGTKRKARKEGVRK